MKKYRRGIKNENNQVPYLIIKKASEGNIDAIDQILNHYKSYIRRLSTRKVIDEYGHIYYCVDEELQRRLEIRLITLTLKFDMKKK